MYLTDVAEVLRDWLRLIYHVQVFKVLEVVLLQGAVLDHRVEVLRQIVYVCRATLVIPSLIRSHEFGSSRFELAHKLVGGPIIEAWSLARRSETPTTTVARG